MSAKNRFYLITLTAVLAILATLALGRWQLSRAAQKEALQATMEAQSQHAPLTTQAFAAMPDPTQALHRIVKLRGHWVPEKTVFLDNRQMDAKQGFFVLTPLLLDGVATAVVVQRGWVARNFLDRTAIPEIITPTGLVEVNGRIALSPAKLYELGGAETGLIRQNLDLIRFKAETGLPLMPVSITQTGPATEGLLRDWPSVGSSADKNYGYAFQWFGLSALIAILYVWFQIGKRFNFPRRA